MEILIEFNTKRPDFMATIEEFEMEDKLLFITFYKDGKQYRKVFKMWTIKRICMH